MKASNLNISELIQFSPGFVGIQGRRLLIHDLSSLGQFRRDLIEMVGMEMARRILTRKGVFWGQADSAAMQRLFKWEKKEELIRAVTELMKIVGMGLTEVACMTYKEDDNSIDMQIICADSVEVEQHRSESGKASEVICWVMAGYLSGYVSYCINKDVYFIESQCQGTEAASCIFRGKDINSWGNDIINELPFFSAADIHKKVQQLSIRIREQQKELAIKQKQLNASTYSGLPGVQTRSKTFQNVLDLAARVASFDTTVLITGETGCGKEILARHIHDISNRKKYPFLAVNCSALPESLLENELFGHKAGAFTGAKSNEVGLFEAAQRGTIFLDEIGDISPAIQAKLLRVLQSKEIRPIGDIHNQQIDVRVISATNRDLDQLAKEGRFRNDLLYRLRVLQLNVPPLRERTEDILPLTRYFLDRFRVKLNMSTLRLAPETVDLLLNYGWPGNIRELENSLEHAAILCTDGTITPETLPSAVTGRTVAVQPTTGTLPLEEVELNLIRSALNQSGGNRAEAARMLKISESTLYRRLRKMTI